MKRFIFEERHGLHIIDLSKTLQQLRDAVDVVQRKAREHASFLIVGTKKQAKELVKEIAEEHDLYYVNERWLGGTLTNLKTIRQSVKKLELIEKKLAAGGEGLTKKEIFGLEKQQIKLSKNLSGIRAMRKPPTMLIVVDPETEHIAVAEARKLGIPVLAIADTNCDPDKLDYIIAGNDDALRSIRIILNSLATAIGNIKKADVASQRKAAEAKKKEESPAKEKAAETSKVEEKA